jgi:hypothetical protein
MIKSPADLIRAKRAYAAAGFVYKGKLPLGDGRFAHQWEKANCPKRGKRTSRPTR